MAVTWANTAPAGVPPRPVPRSQRGICTGTTCCHLGWFLLLPDAFLAKPRSVFWRFWQKRWESLLGSLSSPPPNAADFFQPLLWEHLCLEELWCLQGSFWLLSWVRSPVLCRVSVLTCSNLLGQTGSGLKSPHAVLPGQQTRCRR